MGLRKSKISVLHSFSPKPTAKDNLAEFCAPGTTYFERMMVFEKFHCKYKRRLRDV